MIMFTTNWQDAKARKDDGEKWNLKDREVKVLVPLERWFVPEYREASKMEAVTVEAVLAGPSCFPGLLPGRTTHTVCKPLRSFRTLLKSLAYFKAVRPVLRLRQPSLTILSVLLTCNWPRNYSRAPGSSSGTRDDHAHDCRRGCQHREPRKRQCDHDLYGRELRAWM